MLLFIDANMINSGLDNIVNGENSTLVLSVLPLSHLIFVISRSDGWNCGPKHVAYVRRKWMLEHLCCFGLITI